MKRYLLTAWTGPVEVRPIADKLREAGITVKTEGTERVWFYAYGESPDNAKENTRSTLESKHHTDFGLKLAVMRQENEEVA